jgi:hypothetical protein
VLWGRVVEDTQLSQLTTTLVCLTCTGTPLSKHYEYFLLLMYRMVTAPDWFWYRAQELVTGRTQWSPVALGVASFCVTTKYVRSLCSLLVDSSWLLCRNARCLVGAGVATDGSAVRCCQCGAAESSGTPNGWFEELPSCGRFSLRCHPATIFYYKRYMLQIFNSIV